MKDRKSPLLVLLPLTAALSIAAPVLAATAPNSPATPGVDGAYRQEVEKFRADRDAELRDEKGWLTLVGLFWLKPGENRFGSDPEGTVVLPAGKAPAVAGTLVLDGMAVTAKAAPGAEVTSGGKPVSTLRLIVEDEKGTDPTVLERGTLRFYAIQRGDRIGVRVKDTRSPALVAFHGMDDYPIRPDWRIDARWEKSVPPKQLAITNILGMVEHETSPGAVVWEQDGKTYRLDALQQRDGTLFLIFGDQTNGHETYGAGRFLSTVPPHGGKVVVDFNKAYNPPCVFTPYATCPLPPPGNKLALRIEAGEKKYGTGTH